MVTLIIGGQGSGKTTTAKKMTEGKKTVWVDDYRLESPFCLQQVDTDTEYIVIEEVEKGETVVLCSISEQLIIDKPCQWPQRIDTPNIIITSNTLTRANWESWESENIELIEM